MVLKIAQLGQPVLRQKANPVPITEIATAAFQDFLEEMRETMEASRGVGLAAPQVFDARRVFLAAILPPGRGKSPEVGVFINPRLSNASEEKRFAWEGCLSFLELMVRVPRHQELTLDYLDQDGQPRSMRLAGFPARVVQHEFDHLDGILTIDRAASSHDIVKASEIDIARKLKPDDPDE